MSNWNNIKGIRFISHGEWADSEIIYKGYTFNPYDLEDSFYDEWKHNQSLLQFEDWLSEIAQRVKGHLNNLIASGLAEKVKY